MAIHKLTLLCRTDPCEMKLLFLDRFVMIQEDAFQYDMFLSHLVPYISNRNCPRVLGSSFNNTFSGVVAMRLEQPVPREETRGLSPSNPRQSTKNKQQSERKKKMMMKMNEDNNLTGSTTPPSNETGSVDGETTPLTDVSGDLDLSMEEGRLLKRPDVEPDDLCPPHLRNDEYGRRHSTSGFSRAVSRQTSIRRSSGPRQEDASDSFSLRLKKSVVAAGAPLQLTNSEVEASIPPALQRQQDTRLTLSQTLQPGAFAMRSGIEQRRTRDNADVSIMTNQTNENSRNSSTSNTDIGNSDRALPTNSTNRGLSNVTPSTLTPATPIAAMVVRNGSRPPNTIYGHMDSTNMFALMRDRRICTIIFLLLLIIAGLIGGIVYVVTNHGNNGVGVGADSPMEGPVVEMSPSLSPTPAPVFGPTPAPTVAPTPIHQEIFDILVANSHDNGQSLANVTSPQSLAAQQLLRDPNVASYSVARLLQRYSLGVFYLIVVASSDSVWTSIDSTNECSWEGLTCNGFGQVVEMELQYTRIKGSLPEELGLLSTLSKQEGLTQTEYIARSISISYRETGFVVKQFFRDDSDFTCPTAKLG